MGLDLTGIGSVADFAGGIMDRFWPPKMTEAEKVKAQAGLEAAIEKRDMARDAVKAEVMKAELSQGDNYTKRARPTIVYAGLIFICLIHVIFPIIAYISKGKVPALSLPSDFWYVWGGVCSVWMVGRTVERRGNASKVINAITGNK